MLGPVPEDAGLGWLRLPSPPPAAGYALPEADRAALDFLAAAPPEAARRVRRLGMDATGALSGRIDGGPALRLGRPEHLAAKARALGLVLAQVPAEDLAAPPTSTCGCPSGRRSAGSRRWSPPRTRRPPRRPPGRPRRASSRGRDFAAPREKTQLMLDPCLTPRVADTTFQAGGVVPETGRSTALRGVKWPRASLEG